MCVQELNFKTGNCKVLQSGRHKHCSQKLDKAVNGKRSSLLPWIINDEKKCFFYYADKGRNIENSEETIQSFKIYISLSPSHFTHTYTHTHIYMCECVYVCMNYNSEFYLIANLTHFVKPLVQNCNSQRRAHTYSHRLSLSHTHTNTHTHIYKERER